MAIGTIIGLQSSNNDLELTLSKNFIWLDKNESTTATVNTPSNGKIYVVSSANDIISTTINDNIITLTALKYGSAIITVSQDTGTGDYANKTPASKTILVTNMDLVLENTSWEAISEVSQEGSGNQYWSIGDTKSITLNGTIGTLTLSNFETNVFILHFNYSMNGVADNNIIWGGFKNNVGIDIVLVDSYFKSSSSTTTGGMYFCINRWENKNYGGWKGSDFRYDILGATSTQPSDYGKTHTTACIGYDATSATLTNPKANTLLAALPSDFRNALRLWNRWIDAVGNNSNVDVNIKETIDAITLLAEFEVHGTRVYANQYEQNYQSQMEYYKLGNSKVKYQHDAYYHYAWWWLASPCYNDSLYNFCCVSGGSGINNSNAGASEGIAPAFKT